MNITDGFIEKSYRPWPKDPKTTFRIIVHKTKPLEDLVYWDTLIEEWVYLGTKITNEETK